MLGGNHHGVLGDPQKGSRVKHLCGNGMYLDKLDLTDLMN